MAGLDIRVTATNAAAPGLGAAQRQVDQLGRSVQTADRNIGRAGGGMRGLGSAVGAVGKVLGPLGLGLSLLEAGQALIKFGGDSIKAGSDLQQSMGASAAVFGRDVGAIEKAAAGAASSVGLSRQEYLQLAATLGAGLKNQGIKDFGTQTQGVIKLGADLAAQFGGSTQQAIEAIGSLMRGEADPIEKYGISIKQSAINAELAAKGQSKLTGAARTQAEAQARLALLMKQAGSAQGAFGRETTTLAGQQQRLTANFDNLKATIGTALLPVLTQLVGGLNQAVTGTGQIGAAVQFAGQVIQTYAKPAFDQLVASALSIRDTFMQAVGGPKGMQDIMTTLGPVVLQVAGFLGGTLAQQIKITGVIIGALIRIIAGLVRGAISASTAMQNFGRRIAATPTGQAIFRLIKSGVDLVKAGAGLAGAAIGAFGRAISAVGQGVFHLISPAISAIASAARSASGPIGTVGTAIANVSTGVLGVVASTIDRIANAASSAAGFVRGLADAIRNTPVGQLGAAIAGLGRDAGGGPLTVPDIGRRIVINNSLNMQPRIVIDGAALRGVIRSEIRAVYASSRSLP